MSTDAPAPTSASLMTPPSGNCPVQSYGTHCGWLLYFRARDGWEFRAWGPEQWDAGQDVESLPTLADQFWSPRFLLDEDAETEPGFPAWSDDVHGGSRGPFNYSEDYPGWWSPVYAEAVRDWCLATFRKMLEAGR